jgi:TonB-dependent starch-binding outer membrane protein SusC
MKTICKRLLFLLIILPVSLLAQSKLTGTVTDKKLEQPLPGVNVTVKGKSGGTATDFSGNYSLSNLKNGDLISFSFLGFQTYSLTYNGQQSINIALEEELSKLEEVVIVGYGSVKKKDATGSVTTITSKEFNKGSITSVDQLLTGKTAGVRITNNGGSPDAPPNIRIRGGGSLSAENSPLIVIDGVPLGAENAAGNGNPLALLNPNDIESFNILKDASATAIYGSRASNGVIIITTKKGATGKPEYNFSSNVAIGSIQKRTNVKNGQEFAEFIRKNYPTYTNSLGIDDPTTTLTDNLATPEIEGRILSDTDWQDAIYRESVTTDNNFSARANLFKKLPFRASIGYTNNQGIVKTSDFERVTTALKLTPTLLDKHLKIDINAKGSFSNKNAVDEGGIFGNALNFDPTKPIYANTPNNLGSGYYQGFKVDGAGFSLDGPTNPLAIIEQRDRPERVRKFLGNIEFDYRLHFFPKLRAVLNLGLESSTSDIEEVYKGNAIQTYRPVGAGVFNPGTNFKENQTVTNKLMDAYLAYNIDTTKGLLKKFDIQGGYSYQNFVSDGNKVNYQYNNATGIREEKIDINNRNNRYYNSLNLQSFFGRSNIDLAGKYLFTFSFRADGSSLFLDSNRWGYFPAAAFAWKISDEKFLADSPVFSNLKLRLGAGKTGQQNITGAVGYYPSNALFSIGDVNSQYLPGTNSYTALAYNPSLTWEKTTTYNLGLDFDLLKNKTITGSVDFYKNKTTDLLAKVTLPPGQGLSNEFVKNVGTTEGRGFETNLNIKAITNDRFNLDFNGNVAFNYTKVTDLNGISAVEASESGLPIGTGVKIARHAVGFQPYSAWVYEQIYNTEGSPIEGAFVDRNKDGQINDSDRIFKAMRPNWTFGFGFNANYKNFDLSTSFRGQKGGLTYNTRDLVQGNANHAVPVNSSALSNVTNAENFFQNNIGNAPFSDYFLQDASFIRFENVTLGYKFKSAIKNGSLRIYIAGNNLALFTNYKGQDPENFNAIDNNFYPRPKVYSFGVNLNF